jgi:outer membrane receptor protein involved in Fe transport
MHKFFAAFLALSLGTLSAQISGKIVDETNQGLPSASVALYQSETLTTGASTGLDGSFSLKAPPGNYLLKVTFVSFKPYTKKVQLKADEALDLGTIALSPSAQSLEEVTVEAEAKMMEFRQDKRVFNVGKDLANAGSNASDILDNIPSVTVDVEGQVSLRGSQNVRILINGKPSGLVGSDPATALRQLQGNIIERIEVITNPSARYDAEGEAGIINIVLKKQDKAGLNGSFNLQGGYPTLYGAGATLNYRKNKLNFFTNLNFNYNRSPGRAYSRQNFFYEDTSYYFERDRDQLRGGLDATLRFGADYNINKNQTLTTSFLYSPSRDQNLVNLEYRDFTTGDELLQIVERTDDENEDETTLEGTLSWQKQFDDNKDHKWTADFRFTSERDREQSTITEDTLNRPGTFTQDVDNTENQSRFLIQSDYVKPLGEDRSFEIGTRLTLRTIENNYALSNVDENGTLVPVEQFTNAFTFVENVYAAYAIYNGAFSKKFTYQTGLRAEYTAISTQLENEAANNRDYPNLFPSAFLTYKFNPLNDLQASYSRRISRPGFWSLAPFFGFSDNRNFFSGNPDVNPEFTDSYELGYVRYFEGGSLYSGAYYRHRTEVIERIRQVDANGFTRIFPVNLATQDAYGFEFNLQYEVAKWFSVNGNLNLFRAITVGNYEGQSFNADNFSSSGRIMNRFKVWNSDLQVSFNFRGPATTTQGRSLGRYVMDLGWSKDIMKDKATIALSVRDLFNTRYRRNFTQGENFRSYSLFQWRERQITATFTYRLNQAKSRRPQSSGPPPGSGGAEF